jgi:hypothetical protein
VERVALDIPGFSGYQASEDGEIIDIRTGRVKRQRRAGNGMMQVDIGRSTQMVHNLVARAFHGRPAVRGYRVKNLNGRKDDNRANNLVWAGAPKAGRDDHQQTVLSADLDREYYRVVAERQFLAELMQT